jgi:hypothetical protein
MPRFVKYVFDKIHQYKAYYVEVLDKTAPKLCLGVIKSRAFQERALLGWSISGEIEIMAAWYREIDRFARRKKKFRRIRNPTVAETQAFYQEVQTHAVSIAYFRDQSNHVWELVEELVVYRKVVEKFLAFMCLQRQSLCGFGKLPIESIRMVGYFLVKKVHFSESEVNGC